MAKPGAFFPGTKGLFMNSTSTKIASAQRLTSELLRQLDDLILRTPTGPIREKITEANIAAFGIEDALKVAQTRAQE